MPGFVMPSAITLGALAMLAAVAFVVLKTVKGGDKPAQMAFHYLVSGGIVLLYFAALLPWVYWFAFEWFPQPDKEVKFDNGVLEFLMRGSLTIGVLEHLVALGILAVVGYKGNLKIAFTIKVIAAAAVVMLFFADLLPWILYAIDVIPSPSTTGDVTGKPVPIPTR